MSSGITHFPQQLIFHSLSPSVFYGGVDLKAIYPVFRSDQHYAIWYYPAGHLPPPRCNHNIHELNIQASLTSANYDTFAVYGLPLAYVLTLTGCSVPVSVKATCFVLWSFSNQNARQAASESSVHVSGQEGP